MTMQCNALQSRLAWRVSSIAVVRILATEWRNLVMWIDKKAVKIYLRMFLTMYAQDKKKITFKAIELTLTKVFLKY